jgi:hypothetical protein
MSLQPWFTFQTEKSEEEKQDDAFIDALFDQDDTEEELQPTRNIGTLTPELQKLVDESSARTGWIF